jgi:hypothetical protein
MKHFLKTLPILLLFLTFSLGAQTPAIPDTPAGRAFQAWLDAFNRRSECSRPFGSQEVARPLLTSASPSS